MIDRDKVFGLNLTVPEDAKELIKPWNERESVDKWVDSGVDDQVRMDSPSQRSNLLSRCITRQLIIHVPFTQNVKIRSILLKPGTLVLFENRLLFCLAYVHFVGLTSRIGLHLFSTGRTMSTSAPDLLQPP